MKIKIRGTPIAKQSFRRWKNKNTGLWHNAPDEKVEAYNDSVIAQITTQLPPDYIPMSKAIRINYLEFRFKNPKNWNRQLMSILMNPKSLWEIGKDNQKDCDNLLKAIGDAFNSIVWVDDRLVIHIKEIKKLYSQTPGITIDFEEIQDYCGKLPLLLKDDTGENEEDIMVYPWDMKKEEDQKDLFGGDQ
jgi:Holliday junction resolvase RusA-like endonuclease